LTLDLTFYTNSALNSIRGWRSAPDPAGELTSYF